jgi:hypothetical protein
MNWQIPVPFGSFVNKHLGLDKEDTHLAVDFPLPQAYLVVSSHEGCNYFISLAVFLTHTKISLGHSQSMNAEV